MDRLCNTCKVCLVIILAGSLSDGHTFIFYAIAVQSVGQYCLIA
jgi:hypothetical protein